MVSNFKSTMGSSDEEGFFNQNFKIKILGDLLVFRFLLIGKLYKTTIRLINP